METLNEQIEIYKKTIRDNLIPKVYREIIEYIMAMRTYLSNAHSNEFAVSAVHQGYMDATYFTLTPLDLKPEKLKFAIVFDHEKIRFDILLTGQSKDVRMKYREKLKSNNLVSLGTSSEYSIVEEILCETPNFDNLDDLTRQIEGKAIKFIQTITNTII